MSAVSDDGPGQAGEALTVDGTYLIFVLLAFLILLLAEHLYTWSRRDQQRRMERLRDRRLWQREMRG